MSKKVSLMLAIIVALLGIVIVSVFGKLPENLYPKIIMQEMYFSSDKIEINKTGEKIYYMRPTKDNLSIDLYDMVQYRPLETTNIDMYFSVNDPSICAITKTGLLTFYESSINSFSSITVTVTSKDGSNLKDTLKIIHTRYKDDGKETYDDFDFFA